MPTFVFRSVLQLGYSSDSGCSTTENKTVSEPLCAACFHAQMQYGANARRAISCAYGGAVSPVKLDVLYCTNYQARSQPTPRPIGFVHQIAAAK